MEKVAIAVLSGYTTNRNKNNVNNFEMFNIAKVLSKMFQVDILTGKQCDGCISVDENFNINKYSRLFIVNGSVNNFGGLEVPSTTIIYNLMHKFKNKMYYILTDTLLTYKDYWSHIHKHDWSNKYNEQMFSNQGFIVLSQFKRLNKVAESDYCKEYIHINWPLYLLENQQAINNSAHSVDLIYGGSFRSGRRKNKMLDYFFNRDINVELFSSLSSKHFKGDFSKVPKFTGRIPSPEVTLKNSTSLATIIMGDSNYHNNTVTLRFYESVLSGAITFIDNDFDPEHKLLKDDYFYVNNGDELEAKIKELKEDKDLVNKLKQQQLESLPKDKLSDKLKEILSED